MGYRKFLAPSLLTLLLTACGGGSDTSQTLPPKYLLGPITSTTGSTTSATEVSVGVLKGGELEPGATSAWTASFGVLNSGGGGHAGNGYAWFAGYNFARETMSQDIALTAKAAISLQFWYRITTSETGSTAKDTMTIDVFDRTGITKLATLKTYSNLDKTSGWLQSSAINLSPYAGQTVRLQFTVNTDLENSSSFFVDDIVLTSTAGSGSGDTPTGGVLSINGARAGYTISRSGSSYSVVSLSSGATTAVPAGTTSIKFTDFTVNLGIADKSKTIADADLKALIELYVAFFNRTPDADGLSYWIDQFKGGASIEQIANTLFAAAVQYSSLTGYTSTMSDADFVRTIYKNVLGRTGSTAPTTADVNYWAAQIASGTLSRGGLVRTILSVAHGYKTDATYGWVANLLDNKISVASTFAVQQGLSYNSPTESITKGMEIAAAVTATDTASANNKFAVTDTTFAGGQSTGSSGSTGGTTGSGSTVGDSASCGNSATTVPTMENQVVSATEGRSFAVKSDGSLWSWGGIISRPKTYDLVPRKIGSDFVAVSAGFSVALALKKDGSLYAWKKYNGILYDTGDSILGETMTLVGTGFKSISVARVSTAMAIKTDGTLWSWGNNPYGNVNDGKNGFINPITLIGSGYAAVAAGDDTSLALKTDGSIWAWGKNDYGQFGNGTKTSSPTPVQVGTNGKAVAVSAFTTAVIKSDCSLWVSGAYSDTIGEHTGEYLTTPKKIEGTYKSVSLGELAVTAIKPDDSLWAWGQAGFYLGNGGSAGSKTPVKIGDGYKQVSVSDAHTVAVTTKGEFAAWGQNIFGSNGDGTTNVSATPKPIASESSTGTGSTGGTVSGTALGGTWCADISGNQNCWVFDSDSGSSTGSFYQQSINQYSGTLTNTMTWSVNTAAKTITYRFTFSRLTNSADAYAQAVNGSTYTFPYSISGRVLTFQGIAFTRK